MAVTWGSSEGDLQVGIDISQSPSSVSNSTSSVTLTVTFYVRAMRGYADNQTLTLGGHLSGSYGYRMDAPYNGGTTVKVVTRTLTVGTSFSGTVSRSFSATVSGSHNGATPSESRSWSVGRRPIGKPAAPTSVKIKRKSDTVQSLSWSNRSSTSNPYTGMDFARREYTTSGYSDWAFGTINIASPQDCKTYANHRYQFAIRAKNSAGVSSWVYSDYISTTPAAPSSLVATRDGSTIDLKWKRNCIYGTSVHIWHWENGVQDSKPIGTVSASTTSWTHSNPTPGKTHTYRVRHYEADGNLSSALSNTSAGILIQNDPKAPTNAKATRVSDTQQKITWSNTDPNNAANPYKNVVVQRWADNTETWATLATLGVTTSYTDSTTSANHFYRYRIYAKNNEGNTGNAYTEFIATTPAAPSNVKAVKDGPDIALTWQVNSDYGDGIELWHSQDGTWDTTPLATLSSEDDGYVDESPTAGGTHSYRLRYFITASNSYSNVLLYSAWTATTPGILTTGIRAGEELALDFRAGTIQPKRIYWGTHLVWEQ